MKVLILNGQPQDNPEFEDYLKNLQNILSDKKIEAEQLQIRSMNIGSCLGCWDCWVKTPGLCRIKDDQDMVLEKAINSDLVIFASPMIMGFPSSILKKSMDRFIPLLHPYFSLIENESHHSKRYDKYPLLGFIVQEEPTGDEEDLEILKDIANRFAINFMSEIKVFETISKPVKILADEISSL